VSADYGEWVDVSGGPVIGFLSGLGLNGNLNLKVEEIGRLGMAVVPISALLGNFAGL
jgi:hypothetical protein